MVMCGQYSVVQIGITVGNVARAADCRPVRLANAKKQQEMEEKARILGQLTGSVESRYLDTYSGILALEADKATVARLTLRTGGQAGAAEARRPPTRPSRDKREAAEERKKPPMKTMSSGSLLKEYRVEKQRPATPSVPEEAEVSDDSIGPAARFKPQS